MSLEIHDLSRESLTNKEKLIATYGYGSRLLNGEITENIPLFKTLNYLPAKCFHGNKLPIQDIISSPNNVYSLVVL